MVDVVQRGPAADRGSTVNLVYSERSMKCYAVTESELRQIGLANTGITAFFGIGSALIAFGLDIFKDMIFTDKVPEMARVLSDAVLPLCLGFGVIFWIVAGVIWWQRSGMIVMIKEESSS